MGDHQGSVQGEQTTAQEEGCQLQEINGRIDMLGYEAHPKLFQQIDGTKRRIAYHEDRLQAAEVS